MKLGELARMVGGDLRGDPGAEITGVAPVEKAVEGSVTLLYMRKYIRHAAGSSATAFITGAGFEKSLEGRNIVVCTDPAEAFSRVLGVFAPKDRIPTGISARASVAASAFIGDGATIMDFAFVGEDARIGRGTAVFPGVYVGAGSSVGEDCTIYPNAVVRERCIVGNRCIIHPGVVIGADGFGYTTDGDGHHKVPQIGRAILEDDVEIGSNSTIDRGTVGDTVICRGAKIDNLVMIGHNVRVGENSILVAQTGVSGSTKIGSWTMLGGQAGITGHLEIGSGVRIAAQSGIMHDVEDGAVIGGSPAVDKTKWMRQIALTHRLEELFRDVRDLKKRAGGGEEGSGERKG